MKKIAIIFLVLVFIGAMPISCNLLCGGCGCGDFDVKDFTITSFGVRTTNSLDQDIDTTKAYPFDAIYKTLHVTGIEFVAIHTAIGSLFINTAIACSPVPPKAAEYFQEIKIISLSDITLASENEHISTGQDITDRFVMANFYSIDFKSIDNFIKDHSFIEEEELSGYVFLKNHSKRLT